MNAVIVATPHKRNDALVEKLAARLPSHRIVRVVSREELEVGYLAEIRPEWIFFPHWSWIIPSAIYDRYECVIFHMTDLPYGRGGSPLQNLIISGHRETMLSAIKCVAGLDAGPVYKKVPLSLDGAAEDILQRAAALVEDLIVDIVENRPTPVPQAGKVVEFRRRLPEDGDISALEDIEKVYDYIRMLDAEGYPPAFIRTPFFHFDFSQARQHGDWIEATVRIRRKTNE